MTDQQASVTASREDLLRRFADYWSVNTTPDEAFALFEEARAAGCPVPHTEQAGGFGVVLNYHDAKRIHTEAETFSNEPSIMRPLAERPQLPPLEFDGHAHKEWRKLFKQAANRHTPERIERAVREDVIDLIDQFGERGCCDLVSEFAEQIPLFALCHMLGIERERAPEFRRLAQDFVEGFNDVEKGPKAIAALVGYGIKLVMERQQDPRDDYLTWLGTAELNGRRVEPEEIGLTMFGLLVAGHDTSVSGLTSTLYEVLSRPAIRQALLDDPGLIPAAVEESLRLHPPFIGFFRRAKEDTTIAGVDIPAGASLQICWAAANRDPEVFDDPLEFRLDREQGRDRHLSFGWGTHACVGAPIARMEMRLALEELLSRLPDIKLTDPAAAKFRFLGGEAQAITSLPAEFTPVALQATRSDAR